MMWAKDTKKAESNKGLWDVAERDYKAETERKLSEMKKNASKTRTLDNRKTALIRKAPLVN